MFYKSINWLRGVAIVFVVLSHINYSKYIDSNAVANFFSDGTLLFIFISGFLFFHLIERYEYSSYMKKKLDYVILPYLFVSIPVCLLSIFYYSTGRVWFNEAPHFQNAFYLYAYQISTGGTLLEPLWFVPMICLFFVFSPFLYKIMKSQYFGFAVILGMAFTMTSNRPDEVSPFLSMVHWFGMYLFGGYCCKHYGLLVKNKYNVLLISLIGLGMFHLFDGQTGFINSKHVHKLFMTFMFISLFSILETKVEKITVLDILAKYSFGIFFIHGYVNAVYNLFLYKYIQGTAPIVFTLISCLVIPVVVIKTFHWLIKGVNVNPRLFFGV